MDNIFFELNLDILQKFLTAAGLLAGFAFTAGIELLLAYKNKQELSDDGKLLFHSIWFFFSSSVLLISSSITLSMIANFADRYKLDEELKGFASASVIAMVVGLLLLILGVMYAIFVWGQKNFWPSKEQKLEFSLPKIAFLVLAFVSLVWIIISLFLPRWLSH